MGGNSTKLSTEIIPTVQVEPENPKTMSTPVYRSANCEKLSGPWDPSVRTVWDMISNAAKIYADLPFLGTRQKDADGNVGDFQFKTYQEIFQEIQTFASGLQKLGLMKSDLTNEFQLLGLCGINCPEWVIAEYGCFALGGTTVPFYTTYSAEQFAYAINLCGLASMVCLPAAAERILEAKKDCPSLENIVFFQPVSDDLHKKFQAVGITVHTFQDVMELGKANRLTSFPGCKEDGIYSFVFTSGSTGNPKGVLIRHKNMICNVSAFRAKFAESEATALRAGEDVYLSYLPIEHAMERTCLGFIASSGCSVGFYQGDKLKIMEDLACLRPTFFVSVPRLLNRIHDKIAAGVEASGGLKAYLFNKALNAKLAYLHEGYLEHALWDRLVFSKVRAKLGLDRCRWMATGSAPIHGPVLDWLRVVFGCPVTEGYGQSEVTCVATGTQAYDFSFGHVGQPSYCAEIKLVSVPDMGYHYTDTTHGEGETMIKCKGRGEICVRGTSTMREYYREPEKTKETLDEEGFVHTGDIGLFLPDGRLKIIDRKKNIFKLAQGEYVAPERVEGVLIRSKFIAQAFVYGDSFQSCTVAIICPDIETVMPWAIQQGLVNPATNPMDQVAFEKVCHDPKVHEIIQSSILEESKVGKLKGFEVPRAFHLEPKPFSPETCLTDTMKLQRHHAQHLYQAEIDKLYESLQ